jgi:hypothetical protein
VGGLSLTLADSGGVSESIFHALPDMVRNFYAVSAWPGHERNLGLLPIEWVIFRNSDVMAVFDDDTLADR